MNLKKIISIVLLVIVFTPINAQDKVLNTPAEARAISQNVTQLFKESKIKEAFAILKPYWPIPGTEIDDVEEKTIKTLVTIDTRFGKSEGILKVNEETIKDIAIRETYLVKFRNTAIRLMFVYYKNEKGWIVNSFKWDDKLSEEFK